MAKDENKKVKKEKKEKKNFFKNFKAELKKVIWPTPKQLANNTSAVITIVLITAAIVFVLDFGFEFLNQYGIEKLRDAVSTNEEVNIVNSIDEDANVVDTNTVEEANTVENTTTEEQGQTEMQAENVATENVVAEEANNENQVSE